MATQKLHISSDGVITAIYSDDLAELLQGGSASISRASHVEPSAGGWTADLAPVSGPVLGPFPLRSQALDAEIEYLTERLPAL